MKKNIINKIIVSVLSLSLVLSFSGFVSGASHAANGANILPSDGKWTSFSVRDDKHTGVNTEWESALLKSMDEALKEKLGSRYILVGNYDYGAEDVITDHRNEAMATAHAEVEAGTMTQEEYDALDVATGWGTDGIMGWQSGTHGKITGDNTAANVTLNCKKTIDGVNFEGSTGWDGEYASSTRGGDKTLVGDNPWGLTLTMDGIPVEYGRYYTMEFDISSTLKNESYQKQDKHYNVKAYDYQSRGGPAAAFESVKIDGVEEAKGGTYVIKKDTKSHVEATFKIPNTKNEWSGGRDKEPYTYMGIMFAFGAFAKTYPEENALNGVIDITNMKVTAGTQYQVSYYDQDGKTLKAVKYVNEYEQAPRVELKKKGYTLDSYINMATNQKYNFGSLVDRDLKLKAKWVKTKKPKKASFKLKSKKKKKVTVTFKKNTYAKGYQVKYSYSKKFKKKSKFKTKTKNTSKTKTYTIKSLKSSKVLYVKARAYNKDSCGYKVYGKWSKRKNVYVK